MQLIYSGKTKQSLPRYKFPESLSLSVNPKHFSNSEEPIKIIEEIVLPYVEKERQKSPHFGCVHGTNDIRSY